MAGESRTGNTNNWRDRFITQRDSQTERPSRETTYVNQPKLQEIEKEKQILKSKNPNLWNDLKSENSHSVPK